MHIIPQPKQMEIKSGSFYIYQGVISIDKNCGHNIFVAAKELKKTMAEAGCGETTIVKPLSSQKGGIYLTFEENGKQSYDICVDESGIVVKGYSEQGLFYGIQTLRQIFIQSGVNVPYLEISDNPDYDDRGYYLDISRGRVPMLDGIKKFADKLAFYKYSSFQLYIEHTFAWSGFEEIYTNQGYLTAEEILELDDYCKERYIELVPSFSTFGHLFGLLQSKSFNEYAELGGYVPTQHKWLERHLHHTIDASNPESIELIKEMLSQVMPLFSSNKFNICCDETFDMGKGRSKALAERIGEGQMYVNYLNELCKFVKEQGKTVMFWGDIIRNHMELASQLPDDAICLVWEYHYPVREERYKANLTSSMKNYLCPWISSAGNFIPNYHSENGYPAFENMLAMANIKKEYEVEGFLVTDWGDDGHTCPPELRYPLLAYGGAVSWNMDGNKNIEEFDRFVSYLEYGNENVLTVLKEISTNIHFSLGRLRDEINIRLTAKSADEISEKIKEPEKSLCDDYKKLCELERVIASLKMNETKEAIMSAVRASELIVALKCAQKYPVMPNDELARQLEIWFEGYARIWRCEHKEAELSEIYNFVEYFCTLLRTTKN